MSLSEETKPNKFMSLISLKLILSKVSDLMIVYFLWLIDWF